MQLLIKSIKLKNFRGYGENKHQEEGFYCFEDLDRDFVLINGFNGYGKTSFYEAIEWCLSDSVRRLKKLERVYMLPDLKKGKYLKFQKSNGESTAEREVVVVIQFIDQVTKKVMTITRRTKSEMLGVGDYKSTLSMQNGEEIPREVQLKELDQVLFNNTVAEDCEMFEGHAVADESEGNEINKFLFSNILSQDNLHDFLYTNNLKQRQKLFLKLMNNDERNTLRRRLEGIKTVQFTNKKTAVEREMQLKRDVLERIFTKVQIADTHQYFEKLGNELNEIKLDIAQRAAVHIPLPVQMDNYGAFTKQIALARQNLISKKQSISQTLTGLRVERGKQEEIQLIQQAIFVLQQEVALEVLVTQQLGELNERILDNKKQLRIQHRLLESTLTQRKKTEEQYDTLFQLGKMVRVELADKERTFTQSLKQFLELLPLQIWEHMKGNIDLINLIQQDEKLRIEISRIQQQILENQQKLNAQQTLSEQHADLLETVSAYIHMQTEVAKCPVCESPNIHAQRMTKQGLLRFIAETIAQGNQMTSVLVMSQQTLKETLIERQKDLEALRDLVLSIIENIEEHFEQVTNDAKKQYATVFEMIQTINRHLKSDELKIQRLEQSIRILDLPSDFTHQQILVLKEEIKSSVSQARDTLPKYLRHMLVTDLEKEMQGRKEGLKINFSQQQVEVMIAENEQQELGIEQLAIQLDQIASWLLKEDELPLLQKQHQFEQEIKELQQFLDDLELYRLDFLRLSGNLEIEERAIIRAQLENHPIITWIFKMINPHPFYNNLEIINENGKTQFKSQGNDIQLDQIFSAAQTNILVLSIFLGLGITQKYSALGQLFLDDPIQSMDDVNILAFIDLLRAILDSTSEQNNLVISTHDSNFAKLLRIKMRNRPLVEYRLVGYDEEGPVIERNMNNLMSIKRFEGDTFTQN